MRLHPELDAAPSGHVADESGSGDADRGSATVSRERPFGPRRRGRTRDIAALMHAKVESPARAGMNATRRLVDALSSVVKPLPPAGGRRPVGGRPRADSAGRSESLLTCARNWANSTPLRCGPSHDGREPTVREAVEGRLEGPALVHQKSAVPEEPLRCCAEPQRQNDNGQTPREVPL